MKFFSMPLRLSLAFFVAGIGQSISHAQSPAEDCNNLRPLLQSKGCTTQCYGGSIVLDAGEGYVSYEWSNGAQGREILINSPQASGEYSCRVSTQSGCTAVTPVQKATILPAADKPYIIQQGTRLSATEAAHYSWFCNGKILSGANTRSIEPTLAGEYRVMISDANGCSALSDALTLTTLATNLPERNHDARLRVYPNPSDGRITVQLLSEFEGDILFEVRDINGKEIFRAQWQAPTVFDTFFVNLTSVSNGSYILSAHDGVDVITESIVITR